MGPTAEAAQLLCQADELVTGSRRRVTAGRVRLEHCRSLVANFHQRMRASHDDSADAARRSAAEVLQLRQALVCRATIDQAKGIVMAERGCDADEAFDVLVALSQRDNVKLRDLAATIISRTVRPAP